MSNIDKYETRKKMVYDFMCDDMYVPMKIKELCIVLGVKKEDRPQLEQILLDLQADSLPWTESFQPESREEPVLSLSLRL